MRHEEEAADTIEAEAKDGHGAASSSKKPPVYNKVRGSKRIALDIIRDPFKRRAVLENYRKDRDGHRRLRHVVNPMTKKCHSVETAAKDFECVVNPVTKKCHRVLIKTGVPKFWRARCSWDFGLTHHEFRAEPVDGYKDLCDACFHDLREKRKAGVSNN